MHLSKLYIENFRTFGAKEDALALTFNKGLNVLVGENDAGKSAIIDAIRHLLWTTSLDYHRLTEDDFHVSASGRTEDLHIQATFENLSTTEQARFLEWLSIVDGCPCLLVTMQAKRLGSSNLSENTRISVTVRAGKDGKGKTIEGTIRAFLRTTYLRPLRDAEAELSAGRGSRLSRILQAHPRFENQKQSDFDVVNSSAEPTTLVGIMKKAEHLLGENEVIKETRDTLNTDYLRSFSIGNDTIQGNIAVARGTEFRQILEKFELSLNPRRGGAERTSRGLGVNNVLFMSTELLLLSREEQAGLPLLLIEEPEAHLHPQLQYRLMDFFEEKTQDAANPLQIIVTTHSPNLASKAKLDNMIVINDGKAYPLASSYTCLESSDYRFLERFLDVTKANLFFAKSVVIVEGDAENLLLPTIAELLNRSFSKYGVSIVNVGSVGLFRYSRIFQRSSGQSMPVRVACITDRDVPTSAAHYVKERKKEADYDDDDIKSKIQTRKKHDGQCVETFVSPKWTLEHDLALGGLAPFVHAAIALARTSNNISSQDLDQQCEESHRIYEEWKSKNKSEEEIAAMIYEPLHKRQASKSETAQFLAELLRNSKPSEEKMRLSLPKYLIDAIDYVTGNEKVET